MVQEFGASEGKRHGPVNLDWAKPEMAKQLKHKATTQRTKHNT
jgi:hypothetical protein